VRGIVAFRCLRRGLVSVYWWYWPGIGFASRFGFWLGSGSGSGVRPSLPVLGSPPVPRELRFMSFFAWNSGVRLFAFVL